MTDSGTGKRRRGVVALSELVGHVLEPVTARRGFATAELIAAWPAIAGPSYADCTQPEKIVWPRQTNDGGPAPGVLYLRVDGPRAILVQHELGQIIERVNAFLGYGAIAQARIVQGPVRRGAHKAPSSPAPLDRESETALLSTLAGVGDGDLRAALDRLGRAVLAAPAKEARPPDAAKKRHN
jgi:hypothetical protein